MSGTETTIDLTKGQKIDLTKTNPGLKTVGLGLGWDINASGPAFDLDAFAVVLGTDGKPVHEKVLYFNSPKVGGVLSILSGGLVHSGDNLTGAGDGDDETITAHLDKLPSDVSEVIVCVNIFSGAGNFGQVASASIRVFDVDTNQELMKFDLNEDYSTATGMKMGKIYKKDGEWKFQAIGEVFPGDINSFVASF